MVVVNGKPLRVIAGAAVEVVVDESGARSEPFVADVPAGELRIAGATERERLSNAVHAGRALVDVGAIAPAVDRNVSVLSGLRPVRWGPPPELSPSLTRRLQGG